MRISSLILFIIISASSGSAQLSLSTKIGVSLINELKVNLNARMAEDKELFTGLAVRYRSVCDSRYSRVDSPYHNKGFTVTTGVRRNMRKAKGYSIKYFNMAYMFLYRRQEGVCIDRIFGGMQDGDKHINNDIGFVVQRERELRKNILFYYNLGFSIRHSRIQRLSSRNVENRISPQLIFDIGFRLVFFTANK